MIAGPVALPWYTAVGYSNVIDEMADGAQFPDDYDLWLMRARQVERELMRSGHATCRVMIDAEAFLPWCTERSLSPNAKARREYANAMVGIRNAPRPVEGPRGARLGSKPTDVV